MPEFRNDKLYRWLLLENSEKKNHRALGQLDENDSSFLSVRCFARLQKSAKEQML